MKNLFLKSILLASVLLCINCSNDDDNLIENKGYIVGFDPCTVSASYRIGYLIITEDLKDTIVTYNLSDKTHKIPASVLLRTSDTLYKLPESNFENFRSSPFFEDSLRFNYPINFSYYLAGENEMIFNLCTTDIISLNAPQVIIKSASIP